MADQAVTAIHVVAHRLTVSPVTAGAAAGDPLAGLAEVGFLAALQAALDTNGDASRARATIGLQGPGGAG